MAGATGCCTCRKATHRCCTRCPDCGGTARRSADEVPRPRALEVVEELGDAPVRAAQGEDGDVVAQVVVLETADVLDRGLAQFARGELGVLLEELAEAAEA